VIIQIFWKLFDFVSRIAFAFAALLLLLALDGAHAALQEKGATLNGSATPVAAGQTVVTPRFTLRAGPWFEIPH
jgi:hypothetical protein